jgi:hypothetical protein
MPLISFSFFTGRAASANHNAIGFAIFFVYKLDTLKHRVEDTEREKRDLVGVVS